MSKHGKKGGGHRRGLKSLARQITKVEQDKTLQVRLRKTRRTIIIEANF